MVRCRPYGPGFDEQRATLYKSLRSAGLENLMITSAEACPPTSPCAWPTRRPDQLTLPGPCGHWVVLLPLNVALVSGTVVQFVPDFGVSVSVLVIFLPLPTPAVTVPVIFAVVPDVVTLMVAVDFVPPVNVITCVPVLVPLAQLRLLPWVVLEKVPVVGPPPVQPLRVPADLSVAA